MMPTSPRRTPCARLGCWGIVLWLLVSSIVWAQSSAPSTPLTINLNPDENARMLRIAEDLRCLVCANESLSTAQNNIAEDMRGQIARQMRAGLSDAAIFQFMAERYGEYVLYQPPLKAATLILWFAPPLLALAGVFWLFRHLRRNSQSALLSQSAQSATLD